MMSSFIAVGSGKGGVGKSTTTINIALSLVAQGKKVAIADLDPLSNIAAILDIDRSLYQTQEEQETHLQNKSATLAEMTLSYVPGCDILFPNNKSIYGSNKRIAKLLFETFYREICDTYQIVLIDMPAGIADEFFIDVVPHLQHLVVVVVPEPAAHLSAGGFAKAAMRINPALSVYLWHNKFRTENLAQFNAYNVIDNYNRYVDKENRFTAREAKRCQDIAHVPHEQILDLLCSSLQPAECVWFQIRGALAFFRELQIHTLTHAVSSNPTLNDYLHYQLLQKSFDDDCDVAQYVREIADEFDILRAAKIIPRNIHLDSKTLDSLSTQIARVVHYPLLQSVTQCIASIDRTIGMEQLRNDASHTRHIQLLENRIVALLQLFDRYSHKKDGERSMKRCAVLLSVYLSFSKLLRHEKVRSFVFKYIPTRREHGHVVRDRRRQISHLMRKDNTLHSIHIEMVKQIYPLIIRQIMTINTHYRLSTFNFILKKGSIDARVYLQMVSQIMHEIIHCGLGVIVGIPTSRTYGSTQRGIRKICTLLAHRNKR